MKTSKTIKTAIAIGIITITIQPLAYISHANEISINTTKTTNAKVVYANDYGIKGDGTNESYAFQKMFDTLKNNQGNQQVVIKFKNGHYKSDKRITIYDNMIIEGEGDNVIFTNTTRQPFFVTGITPDHSNYEKLKKDYSGNAASNIKISNITFKNSRVISMNHSKNVQLEKMKVVDQPNGHAIEISASDSVSINNCTFEGMNINDADEDTKGSEINKAIQLSQCTKEDFPHFGSYNTNQKTYSNKNITVSNCSFKKSSNGNSYFTAIGAYGNHNYNMNDKDNTTAHENITIKNCTIDGMKKVAIEIPGAISMTLENNTISNTPVGFKHLNNADKVETKSIKILKNKFDNVDKGIEIEKYKTSKNIQNIEIDGNSIKGKDKSSSTGISILGRDQIKNLKLNSNSYSNVKNDYNIRTTCDEEPSYKFIHVIANEKVNLYDSTSTSAKVIATFKKGDILNVAEMNGCGWYRTSCKGTVCYIKSNIVSEKEATNGTLDLGKEKNIDLRTGKTPNHLLLTEINNKEKVKIEYFEPNGWSRIRYNGFVGYIYGPYLKQDNTSNSTNTNNTNNNTSNSTNTNNTNNNTNTNNTNTSTNTNNTNNNTSNNNTNTSTTNKEVALVTGTNVNFRKEPNSNSSNVIKKLNIGDEVTIESKDNKDWVKVNHKGQLGYISSQYVSTDKNLVIGTITGTNVNFRSEANSTSSKVFQKLTIGDKVLIQSTDNKEWFKVKYNGKVGYISSQYVSTNKNIEIGVVTGTNVNFRTEPNTTTSKVTQQLNKGYTVVVESKDNKEWFKVKYNGKVGYVSSKYITIK